MGSTAKRWRTASNVQHHVLPATPPQAGLTEAVHAQQALPSAATLNTRGARSRPPRRHLDVHRRVALLLQLRGQALLLQARLQARQDRADLPRALRQVPPELPRAELHAWPRERKPLSDCKCPVPAGSPGAALGHRHG